MSGDQIKPFLFIYKHLKLLETIPTNYTLIKKLLFEVTSKNDAN